jgi:CubicO group peptidase (beta-lactamase class C family)
MTRAFLSLVLLTGYGVLDGSGFAQIAGNPRMGKVENGLLPPVLINGEHKVYSILDRLAFYKIPGVSVAVIDNFQVAWAKGYGYRDKEQHLVVDADTLFEAGSISKPVAAVGALSLVERHKLSLDEDVNRKLSSWKVPENSFTAEQKVTLRRLLSHSAGLTIHGFPGYQRGLPLPTVVQVLDGVKPANTEPVRVDIVPGTQFRYSGGGFTIMQLLVTDVAGTSFPDFMARTVLRPIGMTHSTYEQPLPDGLTVNAATAYANGAPIPGKYNTYPETAAAGLWTTPSDLAKFGIELMNSAHGRSNRVLSKDMTLQMLSKQKDSWGLGIGLNETPSSPIFQHGGVDEGFESMLVCIQEPGKGAVVMTNGENGMALAEEILRSVAAEYNWPNYHPKAFTKIKPDPKALETYDGEYQLEPKFSIKITHEGDRLFAQATNQPRFELFETKPNEFFAEFDAQVTFVAAGNGKVSSMILHQGGDHTAPKVK